MKRGAVRKSLVVFFLAAVILTSFLVLRASGFGEGGEGGPCIPTFNFTFTGTVLNSTFQNATTNLSINVSTNVSVYNMSFSNVGEPQKSFVVTNTTNTSGNFILFVPQGSCAVQYIVDVVIYNSSSWIAIETGPPFPPLPKEAITQFLDNGTLYTQPAATLNLTAVNTTGNKTAFNFIVFDNKLGYPLAEQFDTKVNSSIIVVPRDRNYTVVFMITPDIGDPESFQNAVPPLTVSLTNLSNYTNTSLSQYLVSITKNMSFSFFNISGTINVSGNTTSVNMTNIKVKLGLAGLMPPNAEVTLPGGVTITNVTSTAGGYIADYIVQVMGSTGTGIYQVVEWYATNTTNASLAGEAGGEYFAFFQNFTVNGNQTFNVNLTQLAGNATTLQSTSSSLTTAFVSINLTDANGLPLADAHSEILVDNIGSGNTVDQFRYMIDQLSGGVARLPILLNANATLKLFSGRYAPLEKKLNITNASLGGIIQVQLNAFKPRKFRKNGSEEDFGGKAGDMRMRLMKNTPACNVYVPNEAACKIGRDFDAGFDPMVAMMAGKVNIRIELGNGTGVVLYFIGADLLASGPPDGTFSEDPLSETNGTTKEKIWRFGSAAPKIYDRVLVGLPYNEGDFEESAQINFSIQSLYDNDNRLVWNSSSDPNASNVPSDWSDYNKTFFNSSIGGMPCVTLANETIDQCYINTTTNFVWISIPHFTNDEGGPEGNSDTTPPNTTATVGPINDSDLDGNIEMSWTDDANEANETYIILRFTSNISAGYNTSLTNLTAVSRVAEGIQFFEDNTTTGNNATLYWYAIMTVDAAGNANFTANNTLIGVWPWNVTANDTMLPKSPTGLSVSASGATATIRWAAVTQDVNNNADATGLTYKVYRNSSSTLNLTNLTLVNDTDSGFSLLKTVTSGNSTTDSVTSTGFYHYIVTAIDDVSGENKSFFVASNYGNASLTYTATADSSSSGSSGSSGSAGSTTGIKKGIKVSQVWAVLGIGTTTMKIKNEDIGFTEIAFTISKSSNQVEVSVEKLDEKPASVESVKSGRKVYQYIKIDKTNLLDTSIIGAIIKFKVEKKWTLDNNASSSRIVLMRYDDNAAVWEDLTTNLLDIADPIYYHYEAVSPGLSVFAIATKAASEEEKPIAAEAPEEQPEEAAAEEEEEVSRETKSKVKTYVIISVVLLLVIAIAAGGFFYYRKRKATTTSTTATTATSQPQQPKQEGK